jgi:vanillate O-demethylase monooxygenase subunit
VLIEAGVAHAGNGGYHADPKFKASSTWSLHHPDRHRSGTLGHGAQLQSTRQGATASIREGQAKIFGEDLHPESQQRNLRHIPNDSCKTQYHRAVQSRKVIERILAGAGAHPATLPPDRLH